MEGHFLCLWDTEQGQACGWQQSGPGGLQEEGREKQAAGLLHRGQNGSLCGLGAQAREAHREVRGCSPRTE